MTLNTTTTVRDIALEMPSATRIFEKLKIDYCCGGHKPLADACSAAGVGFDDVIRLLDEAKSSATENELPVNNQSSLSQIIQYILDKHHVFTRDEMTRLMALLDKVSTVHGEKHPELFKIKSMFQTLCQELESHMFKEEQVLFPYILRMEDAVQKNLPPPMPHFGTVQNPVRMMMYEHDSAGDMLRQLRQWSSDYAVPPDTCISYKTLYNALEGFEQDLHQHIHLENNLLFPLALEMENSLSAR